VLQLTRKLLHKNQEKVKISATPSQFFSNISLTGKAMRLRFSPIELAKSFAQNLYIFIFLGPRAMISAKSKTPKTISLSRRRLVKTDPTPFLVGGPKNVINFVFFPPFHPFRLSRSLKWYEFCSFSPLITLFRAAYTPSFALRAERRNTKRGEEQNSSLLKDRPPKMAWGPI
jgi:hypothetical protein